MWNFNLMAATRTIETSMAFVLYRLLICLGAALGYLFATLGGAGTLVGFASLSKNASSIGPVGAIVGFLLFAFLMYTIRAFWLNTVKAPQLAVIADNASGKQLPHGKALIDYAKLRQAESFPSSSELFELDKLTRSTLESIATSKPAANLSKVPTQLQQVLGVLWRRLSALNHQTLIAWHFYSGSKNPWKSIAEAIAITNRNYLMIMKNRGYVTAFSWLGFIASYPLLLIGIEKLITGIPINMSFWPYVFAGVFSWALKAAFFDAIAEAAMLQAFLSLPKGADSHADTKGLELESDAYSAILEKTG